MAMVRLALGNDDDVRSRREFGEGGECGNHGVKLVRELGMEHRRV